MQLKSASLTFRELSQQDFPLYRSVFSDEKVMRYAYHDKTDDETVLREQFDRLIEQSKLPKQTRPIYMFTVFEKQSREFVGIADIVMEFWHTEFCGEIGYFLLPKHWGKGYASEMANALVDGFFGEMGLHRICASCNAGNKASERVMQKAGMTLEGVMRKARYKDGSWYDELRYAILFDEWNAKSSKPTE